MSSDTIRETRTIVCGYGEVGHACLAELLDLGVDVRMVLTHRDAPGEKIWFPSVAKLAGSAGIPCLTPDDINAPEVVEAIAATEPDLLFSFYYRKLMKAAVLDLPSRGALNLHGSLLPHYRGRSPVNWVLVHGETETGVTLHYMDEKPDHGDVVARRAVAISRDDTALSLTRKLAAAGREVLSEFYPLLAAGTAPRTVQDHSGSSYFGGRRPSDGEIDWSGSAESIRNLVRAVTDPWPGAFSHLHGRKLLVWSAKTRAAAGGAPGEILSVGDRPPRVATGNGVLELLEVSEAGGPHRSAETWASASRVKPGDRFESSEPSR